MALPPPPPQPPPPPGHDDKQVCYAEQHDLDMAKGQVLHSDAPVAVSGPILSGPEAPWPQQQQQQYHQQQQQYSPPPTSGAIPSHPTDQHSGAATAYPTSVTPSMGWHSSSPPPPSASYTTNQNAFGALPPPPPPQDMAARGGGAGVDKDGLRILGLRPATFFLSVALAIAIIVAAVGGGVGGSIAVQNAKSAAASSQNDAASAVSTVTTTVSVRATDGNPQATPPPARSGTRIAIPPTQGIIDFNCANVGPTLDIRYGPRKWSFDTLCGQDLIGAGIDILAIVVYNPVHCAQACASYNRNLGREECVAVSFQADLSVLANFGDCFLKNSTGTAQKKTNSQVSYKLKQQEG